MGGVHIHFKAKATWELTNFQLLKGVPFPSVKVKSFQASECFKIGPGMKQYHEMLQQKLLIDFLGPDMEARFRCPELRSHKG